MKAIFSETEGHTAIILRPENATEANWLSILADTYPGVGMDKGMVLGLWQAESDMDDSNLPAEMQVDDFCLEPLEK